MQDDFQKSRNSKSDEFEKCIDSRQKWLCAYFSNVKSSSCYPGCSKPTSPTETPSTNYVVPLQSLAIVSRRNTSIINSNKLKPSVSKRLCPDQICHVMKNEVDWIGYDINGCTYKLSRLFIKKEFTSVFINKVQSMKRRKVTIPEGQHHHVHMPSCHNSFLAKPNNEQVVVQQLHRDCCVMASAASGFLYFGDRAAYDVISANIESSLELTNRTSRLVELVCNSYLRYYPKVYRRQQLNPVRDHSPYPTLVRLCGTNGGIGHCVTIVGDIIFDSNTTTPLPLSRESLNWCCSVEDDTSLEFAFVIHAIRFCHRTRLSQWHESI